MGADPHPRSETARALAVAALACVVLWLGWRLFWFLTDDAFIAFRYVSNSRLGFGYVWNPPPFRPVEGYTSFLWVALLDLVWRATDIEPPRAANVLSLVCAAGSVVVTALMAARMQLAGPLRDRRTLAVALVLAAVVTHRTFLTWSSSGLETALFNCLTLAWAGVVLFGDPTARRWVFSASLLAALAALTRPDGVVLVAATGACLALAVWRRRLPPAALLFAVPLVAVPLHLVWRRWMYGDWLPNTYRAKVTGFWPASGARYLLSFVIEHSLWLWLALGALWAWRTVRSSPPRAARAASAERLLPVVAAFAVPFAYYTFVVGGDHFEYRIYSGLVPLLALTALAFVDRVVRRGATALAVLALCAAAAVPISLVQFRADREVTTREATRKLTVPIAQRFPAPLRAYFAYYDGLQAWLIERFVCVRHQEHKIFIEHLTTSLPPRERGARIGWEGRPVIAVNSVGVVGWRFPHAAVIDLFGLNDHVIAESPIASGAVREMAHERRPPPGYVECFKPNVDLSQGRVASRSLTDEEIRACEDRWWPRRASASR